MRSFFQLPEDHGHPLLLRWLFNAVRRRFYVEDLILTSTPQKYEQYRSKFGEIHWVDTQELILNPDDILFVVDYTETDFSIRVDFNGIMNFTFPGNMPGEGEIIDAISVCAEAANAKLQGYLDCIETAPASQSALFLLGPNRLARLHLQYLLKWARERFSINDRFAVTFLAENYSDFFELHPEIPCIPFSEARLSDDFETWIIADNVTAINDVPLPEEAISESKHLVGALPVPQMVAIGLDAQGNRYPINNCCQSGSHVFSRIGRSDPNAGFYSSPIGHFTLQTNGMGPINAFGQRIKIDVNSLLHRDFQQKVVAVFGGSAAWGVGSWSDETFSSVLEGQLNCYCEENKLGIRFNVLNYGQSGHLVLNNLQSYLAFCHRLKPDVVIAHDGYNDAGHGMLGDPWLLREIDCLYPVFMERWSQILHKADHVALSQRSLTDSTEESNLSNQPHLVAKSYFRRKHQFCEIVTNANTHFVWGLQPSAKGRNLTLREAEAVNEYTKQLTFAKTIHSGIDQVYKYYSEGLEELDPDKYQVVNCHDAFSRERLSEDLFWDHVHLNPKGELFLSDLYFRKFQLDIIPRLLET